MSARITRILSIASLLVVGAAGNAVASDIYKWTDDDGNVHYGDRPAEDTVAERLNIQSKPTDRARIAQLAQARSTARRQQLLNNIQNNEPGETLTPEEKRAQAEERAEKCTMYKERLQLFIQSRRLYRQDENGERVYLNEQETQTARENVQTKVEEYCN